MKDLTGNETQMLNAAAAEYVLFRTALQDCVTVMRTFKERDQMFGSERKTLWGPYEAAGQALRNAEQLLSPRPDLRPLKQKDTLCHPS